MLPKAVTLSEIPMRMVTGLFLMGVSCQCLANDSLEKALAGRAAWSAFECSVLASKLKNGKESDRLFRYGYKQGRIFIAAIQAKEITREHLSSQVPTVVLALLEGPSADFMLGRIFESAMKHVLDEVHGTNAGRYNPDELQNTLATGKFYKLNCPLIGK
jgi:hypothetical protein